MKKQKTKGRVQKIISGIFHLGEGGSAMPDFPRRKTTTKTWAYNSGFFQRIILSGGTLSSLDPGQKVTQTFKAP